VALRWRLTDEENPGGQPSLFDEDQLVDRHVGTGEFRGMEFLHVNAKTILNRVPGASHMPFEWTINAYRGCSHACSYCMSGDTPILLADGRTRALSDVRAGDYVYGTEARGSYRRYAVTQVLDHWSTWREAHRVTLADGTVLVASEDHRFLSKRGNWKYVTGAQRGALQRPHLTVGTALMGVGRLASPPKHDDEYKRGYLTGMIRGDGSLGIYQGGHGLLYRFRLALTDLEPLTRSAAFLRDLGIPTMERRFSEATETHRALECIYACSKGVHAAVVETIRWPSDPSDSWWKGFLGGVFDAEGSHSAGILRICNGDEQILRHIEDGLARLGFDAVREPARQNGVCTIRVRGGHREKLRFFLTTDPVTTRKRTFEGLALKSDADLQVVSVEKLGIEMPMYDITTGTGDFIANGVVSHNCFARPTHDYLGLGIGEDFEKKIVVKVNAVERLAAELAPSRWGGHHIAIGTNTDPYQRCEGKYHLYQGMLGVLTERRNPFSILTKSTLVLRDLDLLRAAAEVTDVRVNFSIATLDESVWRATEPGTPHPRRRVEAVRKLNEAGIPCGVLVAPIIPGLSDGDDQLAEVVEAVVAAGAVSISAICLHLRAGVRDVFFERLATTHPDLVAGMQERYGSRAYLPAAEQKAVSERVRALVQSARGRHVGPRRIRHVPVSGLRKDVRSRLAAQGLGPKTADPKGPAVDDAVQGSLF
jgi:DNA repair photolyase